MSMQRRQCPLWVTLVTLAAAAATPAVGQTAAPATQAASIPDFSGVWWHPSLPGFEPPASGPGPVTNR
jgi:ABC-type sugar transport system substrate-binding protein